MAGFARLEMNRKVVKYERRESGLVQVIARFDPGLDEMTGRDELRVDLDGLHKQRAAHVAAIAQLDEEIAAEKGES